MHVLANELRGRKITMNAVATELFLAGKGAAQTAQPEQLGEPEDIANVVSFLGGGPDAAWVNSQVLRANGGFA